MTSPSGNEALYDFIGTMTTTIKFLEQAIVHQSAQDEKHEAAISSLLADVTKLNGAISDLERRTKRIEVIVDRVVWAFATAIFAAIAAAIGLA